MDLQQQARERREAPRFSCAGQAEIAVPGRGLRYRGRIANLSNSGCYIETDCRLERGTSVEVWMNAEGVPLRLAANLMARREGGVGFRFTNVSARQLGLIRSLIAELDQLRLIPPAAPAPATSPAPSTASTAPAPPAAAPRLPRGRGVWLLTWFRKMSSRKAS